MTSRGEAVFNALQKSRCVKGIVGAAVTSIKEAEHYAYIATWSRVIHAIDVRADPNVVAAAVRGRERAIRRGCEGPGPAIIASVLPERDVHGMKAKFIPESCVGCGICVEACPNSATVYSPDSKTVTFNEALCRGCYHCGACPNGAIVLEYMENPPILEAVHASLKAGADGIELHLSGWNANEVATILDAINDVLPPDKILSICIGSMAASPGEDIAVTKTICEKRKGLRTIVQADGMTMGNTSERPGAIQALAKAEQVLSAVYEAGVYVIASGSVTERTWPIIEACHLGVNGVGVGIKSRELMKEGLEASDLYDNDHLLKRVVARVQLLQRPKHHQPAVGKATERSFQGPAIKKAGGSEWTTRKDGDHELEKEKGGD